MIREKKNAFKFLPCCALFDVDNVKEEDRCYHQIINHLLNRPRSRQVTIQEQQCSKIELMNVCQGTLLLETCRACALHRWSHRSWSSWEEARQAWGDSGARQRGRTLGGAQWGRCRRRTFWRGRRIKEDGAELVRSGWKWIGKGWGKKRQDKTFWGGWDVKKMMKG